MCGVVVSMSAFLTCTATSTRVQVQGSISFEFQGFNMCHFLKDRHHEFSLGTPVFSPSSSANEFSQ